MMQEETTGNYVISERLLTELQEVMESINMRQLSEGLRRMFIDYLEHELKTGVPLYFDDFLFPLNCLFDFLDIAAKEAELHTKSKEAGMENEPAPPLTALEKIKAFITVTIEPEKIFLVHHSKDGEGRELIDLLLVIPDTAQRAFSEYEKVISIGCMHNCHVQCSLHRSAYIHEQLVKGHIYYSLVCTKENLIYDDGEVALPETPSNSTEQMKAKAADEFYTGMKRAKSFLEGATNYYKSDEKELALFMVQQATELTLRALLLALSGNEIRTHSFKELKKNCRRYAAELMHIVSANSDEEERLLSLMERAYLQARYANTFEADDSDIEKLLQAAAQLQVKATKIFEERMAMTSSE